MEWSIRSFICVCVCVALFLPAASSRLEPVLSSHTSFSPAPCACSRRGRSAAHFEACPLPPPLPHPALRNPPLPPPQSDTSFVLVHKLSIAELEACHAATAHRRSSRCPKGPCQCRSLGVRQEGRRRVLAYPTPTPATAGGERATSRALTVHHETRRLLFGGRGEGAWGGREWQAGHDTGLREDSISFRPSSSRRLISKFHSRGRD
eukprot:scaffold22446_cov121-Isochrysis_galbana.AAC.2